MVETCPFVLSSKFIIGVMSIFLVFTFSPKNTAKGTNYIVRMPTSNARLRLGKLSYVSGLTPHSPPGSSLLTAF